MTKVKYLYGAAVQGIQSFIFQTNKLREIVGASELVGEICSVFFKEKVGENFKDANLIRGRGGKIQYIFENREECEALVKIFPKEVQAKAPGITLSQAVIEFEGNLNKDHLEALELKLKIQRNKLSRPAGIGFMITERSRRTGNVGIAYKDNEVCDEGTIKKLEKESKATFRLLNIIKPDGYSFTDIPRDLKQITKFYQDSYVAVIHADGNGLGVLLQRMENKIREILAKNPVDTIAIYRAFSQALDQATRNAAKYAYALTYKPTDPLTFRPIVLGGDDYTVVCDAPHALTYTKNFLKSFEGETEKFLRNGVLGVLKLGKMTACAGIAYVKDSYPFHYAIDLAEDLCKCAKEHSKKISSSHIPSSICFHKVQSSFNGNYEEIKKRELLANGVLLSQGPYFLSAQPNYWTIENLERMVASVQEENAPASQLRNWLGELYISRDSAQELMDRIIQILNQKGLSRYIEELQLQNAINENRSHLYDILSIASMKGGKNER